MAWKLDAGPVFNSQIIQENAFLVLCLGIWWRHEIWISGILKFDFLENKKSFWSEIKNIFFVLCSLRKVSKYRQNLVNFSWV